MALPLALELFPGADERCDPNADDGDVEAATAGDGAAAADPGAAAAAAAAVLGTFFLTLRTFFPSARIYTSPSVKELGDLVGRSPATEADPLFEEGLALLIILAS